MFQSPIRSSSSFPARLQAKAFEAQQRETALVADATALRRHLAEAATAQEAAESRAAAGAAAATAREEQLQQRVDALQQRTAELEASSAQAAAAEAAGERGDQQRLDTLQRELEALRQETHAGRAARDAELAELRQTLRDHEREKLAIVHELASVCQALELTRASEAEARAQAQAAAQASTPSARESALTRQLADAQDALQQHKAVLARLQRERDTAVATARAAHGEHGGRDDAGETGGSAAIAGGQDGNVASLQKQNERLRHVVAQMRQDMQALTTGAHPATQAESASSADMHRPSRTHINAEYDGPLRQRVLELEQAVTNATALAREQAVAARDTRSALALEERRAADARADAQERAGEVAALRRRTDELLQRAEQAETSAEDVALAHQRAALMARQETETLLAICVQHAAECAALCGRLDAEVRGSVKHRNETKRKKREKGAE